MSYAGLLEAASSPTRSGASCPALVSTLPVAYAGLTEYFRSYKLPTSSLQPVPPEAVHPNNAEAEHPLLVLQEVLLEAVHPVNAEAEHPLLVLQEAVHPVEVVPPQEAKLEVNQSCQKLSIQLMQKLNILYKAYQKSYILLKWCTLKRPTWKSYILF